MPDRRTTIEVGGEPLAVRDWGEPGAPVVLYLHGAGDDAAQAAPLADALAGSARVVAPTFPGPPRVERPSDAVRIVVGLLDALAVDAATVVGFSWGASVACHLAAGHAGRVRSVVLLEGGHIDFADLRDLDPALLDATARGLVAEPVVPTYAALRASGVPVLLVTAFRDAAVAQLRVDPLRRLREEVPQVEIVRVPADAHELLERDDGTIVGIVRDWLATQ